MEQLLGPTGPLVHDALVQVPVKLGLLLVALRGVVRQATLLLREVRRFGKELRDGA